MLNQVLFSGAGVELKVNYDPDEQLLALIISKGSSQITKRIEGQSIVQFYDAITRLLSMLPTPGKLERDALAVETQISTIRNAVIDQFRRQTASADKRKIVANVFIGLPQKEINLFAIERIQNATGDFMEAMGFELEMKDEPVYGSFFQDIKYFFTGTGKREATEAYQKGKVALELQLLSLPSADATNKLTTGAAALITSLGGINEAALRLGGILLVKVTKDGIPRILAETVSPELSLLLDNNPQLLENPNAIFSMISAMQTASKRIQESGAAEAL